MNTRLMQNNTFKILKRLGLTGYEAVSYLALVKYGSQDCRSLCRLAGIPAGKIYIVAKNLVRKGWAKVSKNERPKRLSATDPEIIMKKRLTELKEELNYLETYSNEASFELKNLSSPVQLMCLMK